MGFDNVSPPNVLSNDQRNRFRREGHSSDPTTTQRCSPTPNIELECTPSQQNQRQVEVTSHEKNSRSKKVTFTLAPMTTTDWTDQRQSVGKEIPEDYDPQIENPRDRELVDLSLQQVVSANSIAINPVLNLSSRQLTEEEQEVLLLGLKFAPTPKKIPDPLEFYEKYHKQCEREYNKLTHRKLDAPSPS